MKSANYKKMYLQSTATVEDSLSFLKNFLKEGDPNHLIIAMSLLRNSQLVCEEIYLESTEEEFKSNKFS